MGVEMADLNASVGGDIEEFHTAAADAFGQLMEDFAHVRVPEWGTDKQTILDSLARLAGDGSGPQTVEQPEGVGQGSSPDGSDVEEEIPGDGI